MRGYYHSFVPLENVVSQLTHHLLSDQRVEILSGLVENEQVGSAGDRKGYVEERFIPIECVSTLSLRSTCNALRDW